MDIAVMGYGIVGSGVVDLLTRNHRSILEKSMQDSLDVKYILDIRDFPGDASEHLIIHDFDAILSDCGVGIVVETIGGLNPAYKYVAACLNAGKSVVTSNKELIAEKGFELLSLAEKNNVNLLFEASVGGGIPIVRPIIQCLAANEINEIAGILNGTTNYILSKMASDRLGFNEALEKAQGFGYAESDPTDDIEGFDSCRKICILASLCFGKHVYPKDVYTEGITKITENDIEYAKSCGGVIKLVAAAKRKGNGKILCFVRPSVVGLHSRFAAVEDAYNAILVRGDAIGDLVFCGMGAGKMPTASAVVADIIDCAKHIKRKKHFGWADSVIDYADDHKYCETALYVRANAENARNAEIEIEDRLKNVRFLDRENKPAGETAFITPKMPEYDILSILEDIRSIEVASIIKIADY
ncbi:MAG: homoserine dehydrogenase [Oscillospiraceae bacterium]|nr:homoserine dehydrogenase [Oscillospiraceae bacterium]